MSKRFKQCAPLRCSYCQTIVPKDENWWEDMKHDTQEYFDSLVDDQEKKE